jgi:hypothetical protein
MSIVHARLDPETEQLLRRVKKARGWSDSAAVRAGLRALAEQFRAGPGIRVIGVGRFASGQGDLGSNKRHLRGFGA